MNMQVQRFSKANLIDFYQKQDSSTDLRSETIENNS